MNVGQLIKELQQYDPKLDVGFHEYDGGGTPIVVVGGMRKIPKGTVPDFGYKPTKVDYVVLYQEDRC